ncbi:molecular chaperone HtpG [Thermogemmatispora tikiterensis]|uniref:Chaperone protein HtpG n=1 Tax=Thermogemmatispora tikiterensis TaxID=1825093 RepID=A0A328VIW2_9CHLR|nr:molecular chaperone HtpG [Thermogemmatispora tikiterensis]RAQ97646.1 molecular chaperone HtpG [Thermogemmatispora tikiterensis]
MPVETHKEKLGFQAEVKQLLDIMIHSLYSNKEIFLRELISNASDAIDRLRFDALSNPDLYERDADFKIRVSYDRDARTITVSDNGIGMSREEVIQNIGTIAKSGTREFFQSLTGDQRKDAMLIGQFGVGFYSSFVVADRVTLLTRRAGLPADQGVRWESDGQGEYTIETIEKPTRGTDVILHLREGEDELLNGYRLRSIIRKYSDHIQLPIVMKVEGKDEEEVVNKASALWARPKSEISEQEYKDFYKYISHDFADPLAWVHSHMEGTHEYTLLLFIPSQAPFDLWLRERHHGVKLYVRRVYIMDDIENKLLPRYLRFVRGVIDSDDLPLNVSREMLQQNRLIDTMRATATKKILGLLSDMAEKEPGKYAIFWREFGRVLKEGLVEDKANRDLIARLLRFASTLSGPEQNVSLETYVSRKKEGQDKIYYLLAESYEAAKDSPLLEIFKQKGIEVLIWTDPIDHFVQHELQEYGGLAFQSIARGEVDLSKLEDKQEQEERQKSADEVRDLLERFKKVLSEKVKDVRTTSRLTTSPACLVVDEGGIDPNLKRLLQAAGQAVPADKPIMEINPQHPIIQRLRQEQDEARFNDWAWVLFDQAVLSSGDQLENPISFVNRLNNLLTRLGTE